LTDIADPELTDAARRAFRRAFGGVILFRTPSGGPLWIDGRGQQVAIRLSEPELPPGKGVCVWIASRETLIRILSGEKLLASSFVSGRLQISGDMSVMTRLHLEAGA